MRIVYDWNYPDSKPENLSLPVARNLWKNPSPARFILSIGLKCAQLSQASQFADSRPPIFSITCCLRFLHTNLKDWPIFTAPQPSALTFISAPSLPSLLRSICPHKLRFICPIFPAQLKCFSKGTQFPFIVCNIKGAANISPFFSYSKSSAINPLLTSASYHQTQTTILFWTNGFSTF